MSKLISIYIVLFLVCLDSGACAPIQVKDPFFSTGIIQDPAIYEDHFTTKTGHIGRKTGPPGKGIIQSIEYQVCKSPIFIIMLSRIKSGEPVPIIPHPLPGRWETGGRLGGCSQHQSIFPNSRNCNMGHMDFSTKKFSKNFIDFSKGYYGGLFTTINYGNQVF